MPVGMEMSLGSLAATGESDPFPISEAKGVAVTLSGGWAGTVTPQLSYDNAESWDDAAFFTQPSGPVAATTTASGKFGVVGLGGATHLRLSWVRVSGTLVYRLTGTENALEGFVYTQSPSGGTDTVQGTAADGAAASGNPVQVGGVDGSGNAQALAMDTSGRQQVVGAAADGAAVAGNPVLVGGQDGTNAQSLLMDTSGRPQMVGAAAAGAAIAGNPVLVGGSDGTNARAILTDTNGRLVPAGKATLTDGNTNNQVGVGIADAATTHPVAVGLNQWNGSGWDRQRNNLEGTLLASAARTATTSSADQTNYNGRGGHVEINISAVSGSPSLVVTIEGKNPITGAYYTLLTSAALVGTGVTVLKVYPGITAAANLSVSDLLPRTWRVTVTAGTADSVTYSVAYHVNV